MPTMGMLRRPAKDATLTTDDDTYGEGGRGLYDTEDDDQSRWEINT